MPHILCRPIKPEQKGLWGEGPAYEVKEIYRDGKGGPPVQYDAHILKPHSFCHVESELHVDPNGKALNTNSDVSAFWGETVVIKIKDPTWETVPGVAEQKIFRVSKNVLLSAIKEATGSENVPARLLMSCDPVPLDEDGYHDSKFGFVLDREAAAFLAAQPQFKLFGTSWKSSDFEPGSRERPVHKSILKNGFIFELLDLAAVAPGTYFMVAMPIPLVGASEAPVCPVLFKPGEIPK